MFGGLNHESRGLSATSRRPLASSDPDEKKPHKGMERSKGISISGAPSSGTWKIRMCELSPRTTIRLWAKRSITAYSPMEMARLPAGGGNGPHGTSGAEINHLSIGRGGKPADHTLTRRNAAGDAPACGVRHGNRVMRRRSDDESDLVWTGQRHGTGGFFLGIDQGNRIPASQPPSRTCESTGGQYGGTRRERRAAVPRHVLPCRPLSRQ